MDPFANISMNQKCLHVFVPANNKKNRGKNWWTTTTMTRRETARRHGHICFAFFCHITRDWYISSEHLRTLDLRLRSDDQCRKKSNSDGPGLRSDHCRSGFPKSFCFSNGQPIITNPLTWGFHRCARSRRAHCNWDAFTWHCPACKFFKIIFFQCIQCKSFPNNGFTWGPLTSSFKNGRNLNIFWDSHPTNCEISNWQWLNNFIWTPKRSKKEDPMIEVHPRGSCIAWCLFWNWIIFKKDSRVRRNNLQSTKPSPDFLLTLFGDILVPIPAKRTRGCF